MRLERSVEGGRNEATAAAIARAAEAWEASARRIGRRRSMASWSWDAVVTDTEKEGCFMRIAARDGESDETKRAERILICWKRQW